jgi:hypothetical protein
MAKTTIVFGILLLGLGVGGYEWKENLHAAALYPVIAALFLLVGGILALGPKEKKRATLLYVNTGLGGLWMLASALMALNGYGSARSEGIDVDNVLLDYRLAMAGILLIYINLCVRAILALRARQRELEQN